MPNGEYSKTDRTMLKLKDLLLIISAIGGIILYLSGVLMLPKSVEANASDITTLQQCQTAMEKKLVSVEKDVQYIKAQTDKIGDKLGVM